MKLERFDGCWTANLAKDNLFVIAGTGSNSTKEALRGTKHTAEVGAQAVLLADCYYNVPSSLEPRTRSAGIAG